MLQNTPVIIVQLIESTRERCKNEEEDEEELPDVNKHAAEGDLQRPELRVGLKEEDDAAETEDIGDGEDTLGDECRVGIRPLVARQITRAVRLCEVSLRESDAAKRHGAEEEREHDEVEPVPPLVRVGLEAFVP